MRIAIHRFSTRECPALGIRGCRVHIIHQWKWKLLYERADYSVVVKNTFGRTPAATGDR
jgi:hypothetical protein